MDGEGKPVLKPGFLEDMHQVNLDSSLCNMQILSDLFVFHPLADEPYYFLLARSEAGGFLAMQEGADVLGIIHPDFSCTDFAKAFHEFGNRQRLLYNPARAHLQSAKSVHFREFHYPQCGKTGWRSGFQIGDKTQRRRQSGTEVDERDVRPKTMHSLLHVAYFGHCARENQILRFGQDLAQTFDHDRLWFASKYRKGWHWDGLRLA